jgi:hypothetical protein
MHCQRSKKVIHQVSRSKESENKCWTYEASTLEISSSNIHPIRPSPHTMHMRNMHCPHSPSLQFCCHDLRRSDAIMSPRDTARMHHRNLRICTEQKPYNLVNGVSSATK